jgi:oligopeptide transport system substrate-binding protein
MERGYGKMQRLILILTLGLVLGAVAACGGGGDKAPAQPATSTPPPARATSPAIAPELRGTAQTGASDAAEPPKGGTLRLLWSDPPTLDPALVTDTTSAGIIVEAFNGLVSLNTDLQIVPDLAESWTITGGGTVYEFKLRKDIKFSDGSPITASDFKYSIERAALPATESPVAEIYLGDIVGVKEIIEGRGRVTEARGVEAVDERTLRLTIDSPKAYFLAKLTYPTAYVVDKKNVTTGGDSWTDKPVSSGPFTISEYKVGQRITLSRNDNYWGRKPYLDRIVLNLAGGQAMAMYENDEVDLTGVGLADLERVQDPAEPLNKDLVNIPPSFSISYIGFHMSKPPFDDPKFRQALNHAVNKELIAEQVYSNLVIPAYGIIPPNFPGFSDKTAGLKFDPDKARQLLAESKYGNKATRPRIIVTIPGTGGSPGLDIEVVADMWKRVLDIDIEIQQVEWATYLQDLNRQRLQAWGGLGWAADYPDPQDFIDILFYAGSPGNHGAYRNDLVDRNVLAARTEQDVTKRIQLYNEAEQKILDEGAWLPLWFDTDSKALLKPWVKNYKFTPIIVPKYKDVYIQK